MDNRTELFARLEDPRRYTVHRGSEWLRWTPSEVDKRVDHPDYRAYIDHSCDLTMRGGTTSGVIYPLAVCSLAQHYVFRSVGGASAGAIAASATAAAEYGRFAEAPDSVPDGSVRPGFAGLAGLVRWLATGDGEWRLAQLFQPDAALRPIFRLATAAMQRRRTGADPGTGRRRVWAVLAAVLSAVHRLAAVAVATLLLLWLAGPAVLQLVLPPDRWDGVSWWLVVPVAVLVLAVAAWVVRLAAVRVGPAATAVLVVPLALGEVALLVRGLTGGGAVPARAWVTAAGAVVLCWLVLSLAVSATILLIYASASWRVITSTERYRFGVVPGAVPFAATWVDRLAGVPRWTGVPPLVSWLADRIDELAGLDPEDRPLTFGALWLGPDSAGRPADLAGLADLAEDPARRVINLALMTTDLAGGRPYQLPFPPSTDPADRWQFCTTCIGGLVPGRIIDRMRRAGTSGADCPLHGDELYWLPEPWDLPVVFAVRMSMPLPGLICAVPLYRNGRVHWFSDGGITSNFPIHFFDTLLPRWPTFGLNLETTEEEGVAEEGMVQLPEQDDKIASERWTKVGPGLLGFLIGILSTSLDWRDTMQAALPGFRGRIANVLLRPNEGGVNLFMPPEVIARLAIRGYLAGERLKERFAEPGYDEAAGFTQTDRHRWIRMRMAFREYRGIAVQAEARAALYNRLAGNYPIPLSLRRWFADPPALPAPDPCAPEIAATLGSLTDLAGGALSEPFDGTPPVRPVLRLTPRE